MDRRKFINKIAGFGRSSAIGAAGVWATQGISASGDPILAWRRNHWHPASHLLAAPAFSATGPDGRKLIIPTDNPDRFKAKVMEFNPVPAVDEEKWILDIGGLVGKPAKLRVADLKQLPQVRQSSRMKCVQCWSARIDWGGFRGSELLKLVEPKPGAQFLRLDCADSYYDFIAMDELLHPHVLFATAMNGEPLTPEHGAPLRLVMPFKYGYKSSKLITRITLTDQGGQGVVADTWPYYTQGGDIQAGYDHPFDLPNQTKKIMGGEITDY